MYTLRTILGVISLLAMGTSVAGSQVVNLQPVSPQCGSQVCSGISLGTGIASGDGLTVRIILGSPQIQGPVEHIFDLIGTAPNLQTPTTLYSLFRKPNGSYYIGRLVDAATSPQLYLTRIWDPVDPCVSNTQCVKESIYVSFYASGDSQIDIIASDANNNIIDWESGHVNYGLPLTQFPIAANTAVSMVPPSEISISSSSSLPLASYMNPGLLAIQGTAAQASIVETDAANVSNSSFPGRSAMIYPGSYENSSLPCNSGLYQQNAIGDTQTNNTQYSLARLWTPCNVNNPLDDWNGEQTFLPGAPVNATGIGDASTGAITFFWLQPTFGGLVNGQSCSISTYKVVALSKSGVNLQTFVAIPFLTTGNKNQRYEVTSPPANVSSWVIYSSNNCGQQSVPAQAPISTPSTRRQLFDTTATGGQLDALGVQGNRLVNVVTGQTVQLKGVNLGGWLETESWMDGEVTPNTASPGQFINDRFALERLETNFGVTVGDQLMADWQNNFITAADFQWIAAHGYNCVRIPFSWRNLQNEQGEWNLNSTGQIDFSRFDSIVQTAAANGIYVIFDLHVWQGQQANYNNVTNSGSLDQIEASQLWNAFSNHFIGEPAIAGFDLLNEVNPDFNTFDLLYQTIRANDPNRIVIVEAGDWTQMTYGQELNQESWTNVMWEPHFYTTAYNDGVDTSNLTSLESIVAELGTNTNPMTSTVPIYVGEFKEEPNTMPYLLQAFNQNGWSWTPWTYKSVNENGWSMRYYWGGTDSTVKSGIPLEVNLTNGTGDSASAIAYEWTTQLQSTANFYDNTQLESATASGTQPISSSNPPASPVSNGVYALVNSANLYALSSSGAASGQTDWVISSGKYNGGVAQQWTLNQQSDGSYTVQNGNGNMLDDYGWSMANGGLIDDWPSNGNSGNERWYFRPLGDGSYQIISQGSYLTVGTTGASLSTSSKIEQNQWVNANTQRWYLVPVNGDPTTVLPPGFTACGNDGGTCTAPSSAFLYAYGAYGSYVVLNLGTPPPGGLPCTGNTFELEDPLPGVQKECFYGSDSTITQMAHGSSNVQPAPAVAANWCSEDGGICTLPSINGAYGPINTIAYGVGASYFTKTIYGTSIACNKAVFGGDPASGQTKSCFILQNGNDPNVTSSPFGSTLCATEGGTCSFVGYEAVSYVVRGTSKTAFFSGSVACNGASFGVTDNAAASCYVLGSSANVIGEGTYKIINSNSGLALEVNGASTQNGGVVDQWGYYGPATNQHWTLVGNGNFQIINQNSGLVLDINGGSGAIDQWSNGGASNQYWYIKPNGDGTYAILSALNNGVLQVTGSSTVNGGALSLGTLAAGSSPSPNQKWYFQAP